MYKDDYELIIHKLDKDLDYINIYPIGDVHVGSAEFDEKQFQYWLSIVEKDPRGYVVMIGDMVDNGLKNSKTNTYEQTMRPFEQKMYLKRMFKPLAEAGKILGMCRGNHENRTSDLSDGCPLYDVASKLDVEDVYRENMVFMKVSLGQRTTERQATYTIVLGHGASKGRVDKFSYSIDGMDILITGHTHQGSSDFLSKIVIDPRNNVINHVGYAHIVVPSFAKIGGYALKAMYAPRDTKKIPVIRLSGEKKSVEVTWRD